MPSKYIEFVNRDDYAGYEETMSRLQAELRELFAQEEESKKAVEKVFEELGYKPHFFCYFFAVLPILSNFVKIGKN